MWWSRAEDSQPAASLPVLHSRCNHMHLCQLRSTYSFLWQFQHNWFCWWPTITNIWMLWKSSPWKERCCLHTFGRISIIVGILRVNQAQKHWSWKKKKKSREGVGQEGGIVKRRQVRVRPYWALSFQISCAWHIIRMMSKWLNQLWHFIPMMWPSRGNLKGCGLWYWKQSLREMHDCCFSI